MVPAIHLLRGGHLRRRIAQEHGTEDCWQVKHVRGGLVDLEFLAQQLQLIHGPDMPGLLLGDTALVLWLCTGRRS